MKNLNTLDRFVKFWTVLPAALVIGAGAGHAIGSELVFDAQFNELPYWANTEARQRVTYPGDTGASVKPPGNFDSYYTGEMWHENGGNGRTPVPGAQPVAQISDFQSRQPGGKSFLIYDESYGGKSQWGSDAQLGKDLPDVYQELWVEFYIKFSDDWIWMDTLEGTGTSVMKLFRARYVPDNYKNETRYDFFGTGGKAKSPVYMLDLKSWSPSPDESYARLKPFIKGFTPQELIGVDENYALSDFQQGSSVHQGGDKALTFEEVFLTGEWVKINILIKMDSAPGAGDGVEEIWINDVLEKSTYNIPYRRAGEGEGVGFNWFSIGGNAHNYPFPEEMKHEQWYAVSDLRIWNGKPGSGGDLVIAKPNPPIGLAVK